MLSLVVSTTAFFIASYFIKHFLDGMEIPKGMTRSMVIFLAAAIISFGVAVVVDWIVTGFSG